MSKLSEAQEAAEAAGDYLDALDEDQVARFRADGIIHIPQAVEALELNRERLDAMDEEAPQVAGGRHSLGSWGNVGGTR